MPNITVFKKNKKVKILFHFPESLSLTVEQYRDFNSKLLSITEKISNRYLVTYSTFENLQQAFKRLKTDLKRIELDVSERKSAGYYHTLWTKEVSSGIVFYHLDSPWQRE